MKDKIRFGNSSIVYSISKSKRRKTSQIIVDASGVEIKTPITKKDSEIRKLVSNKKEWIFKKQLEFADRKKSKIKTKTKSPEYLEKRAWKLASKTGLIPSKIQVKDLKSRWGSATSSGIITLNRALAKTPPRIIDYIIIHELCHLKVKDHSSRYWNKVRKIMPNYEQKIKWLEAHDVSSVVKK